MRHGFFILAIAAACGGEPARTSAPATPTMPLPAPDDQAHSPRASAATSGEPCVDVFTAPGSSLVRGTTEADIEVAHATVDEIVALAPGAEVQGTASGGVVAVTTPVRGFFSGTLTQRCEPPAPVPSIAFDSPPSASVEIPADAEQLHDVRVDVDADGTPDRVLVSAPPRADYGYFALELSRSSTRSSFRVLLTDGIVAGCFGIVDGRPAYVQSLTRGSSAGVRVHILRADGTWRAQSGLLGRALAGARGDTADVFDPPAATALWQGSLDDWLETPPGRCPSNGHAIDVPRDGHYPIDDDEASNELAIVRVHGLSSTYEGLPSGSGPIVEMQTASTE